MEHGNEPSQVRASFLDDCWEPEEAQKLLRRFDEKRQAGHQDDASAICLRVIGNNLEQATILNPGDAIGTSESPGEARYLWMLASGGPLDRETMIALYKEFLEAG